MTECKLFQGVTYKIYSDRRSQSEGGAKKPSRFLKKKNSKVNEKQSIFDNKRSKYNLLCLYIAAYPTPKEKTVVITHLHE